MLLLCVHLLDLLDVGGLPLPIEGLALSACVGALVLIVAPAGVDPLRGRRVGLPILGLPWLRVAVSQVPLHLELDDCVYQS